MGNNDISAMRRNLKRAKKTWGRLSKVLENEEVLPKVVGMFYQGILASVITYNFCYRLTKR